MIETKHKASLSLPHPMAHTTLCQRKIISNNPASQSQYKKATSYITEGQPTTVHATREAVPGVMSCTSPPAHLPKTGNN